MCLVLADRLDTLAGFWAIQQKPTGSKDPCTQTGGLARHWDRLTGEGRFRLPLRKIIGAALHEYTQQGLKYGEHEALSRDLFAFFMDRLKVYMRDVGIRHDIVSAVLVSGDDSYRLFCRARALSSLLATEVGTNLLAAWRRAANILAIENQKDGPHAGAVNPVLLKTPEEKNLNAVLDEMLPKMRAMIGGEDFTGAAHLLSGIRDPLDLFFAQVTVNVSDVELRRNRLRLLSKVEDSVRGFGDFHKIEGVVPAVETAA